MYSNPVKDWFYFSRGQRHGILVMLALIALIPLTAHVIEQNTKRPGPGEDDLLQVFNTFETHMARLEEAAARQDATAPVRFAHTPQEDPGTAELKPFPFDPNILSIEEWTSMGVPLRIARSISNYLSAGGRFRYKQDLKRIYLVDDALYAKLEPWVELPGRQSGPATATGNTPGDLPAPAKRTEHPSFAYETTATETLVLNLNTADTTAFRQIRGIGPVFSRRIVRYRELLGGYHCTSQLMEVFGMDSTRYTQLLNHIETDTTGIRKINLNEAGFGDLVRHPYIDRPVASAILRLREQHGNYTCISDIRNSYLVDDDLWKQIKWYLSVTPD